jgi:hypothetical protein
MLSAEPTLNLTKFVGAVRALRTGSAEFVGTVASQRALDGCALELLLPRVLPAPALGFFDKLVPSK